MNTIENLLLDSGLSWTFSKALPYVAMILIGFLLVRWIKGKLNNFKKPISIFFKIVTFAVPFVIYFLFFPIYEGDFSNSSDRVAIGEYEELKGKKLVVLTIPNCPFCYEAIGKIKKIKERVPLMEVDYIVCSENSSSTDFYRDEGQGVITVKLAKDAQKMSALAKGSFPTFILVDEKRNLQTWSNDNFGVRAIDFIENYFQ